MMLPSDYNQDFAAQRSALFNARRLRERATGDSLLAVIEETRGWGVVRLENDKPGALRERLEGNFYPTVGVALKAARRISNKTREHIKIIHEEQQLKDILTETSMRAEFPTSQDAGVFMFEAGSPGKKVARFKKTLPIKMGRVFQVEFTASKRDTGKLSDIARKNNGRLTQM